ncbi:hypothetical protein [Thalassotalea euphylliae]|uniref:O-antigen ligase domain-containing protein n=1 Tax=Thalassotalea euphylliae TaxID=1655234 RepID=A0A3E0U7Q1_9GAMM|nr:hypothetical protein [Thalassotalea euphylliae]REL31942.1 hypothetical protein DXX94_15130 [Thalassotalea euphylliae]
MNYLRVNGSQLGLVLYFCGVFISWQIQALGILPRFLDIGVILILSLALMFVGRVTTSNNKRDNLFILAGLIILLLYALLSSLVINDYKNLIWSLFGFAAFSVFYSLNIEKTNLSYLAFYFALFCCLVYLAQLSTNSALAINSLVRHTATEENKAFGLVSYTAIAALCFSLATINSSLNYRRLFLIYLFQALVFFLVLISGARSPLFGLALALLYINYILFRHPMLKRNKVNILLIGFATIVLGAFFFDSISLRFFAFIDFLSRGLLTLFNSSGYFADAAALARVYQREIALNQFVEHFYFGAGFKYFWVDFPLLQAFSNGGVFFGGVYLLVFFIYPFKHSIVTLFFNSKASLAGQLLSLLYLCNSPRLFLHGQPYDWQHMLYVIPAVVYFARTQKSG